MALVGFQMGDAAACSYTVTAGSGSQGMALCYRDTDNDLDGDQVSVAICTPPFLVWEDVCSTGNALSGDVAIQGGSGNDIIRTVDGTMSIYVYPGNCAISCYGEVDVGDYTLTLDGQGDADRSPAPTTPATSS
jgi:hypothetical protein